MPASAARQIDWATAEIEGGTLSVNLSGDAPKHWSQRLRVVLALLDYTGDGWGKITPRKSGIRVTEVREGMEQDLRHLLEGALQQVNADFAGDEDETAEVPEEDPEGESDRRMTDTFRAFAASRVSHA
jgi:hypothetical protein